MDASDIQNQQTVDTTVFDLPMEDDDLLALIRRPVQDSEAYWNGTYKLKEIRESNMNLWLPNHWKNKDVYDYQEEYLYQDPRIFTSVETICSIVNARIPQPEVMPAQDTITSQQIAKDLQTALFAHSKKFRVQDIFRIATRNLLLKRAGYIKLRWDPNMGEHGEIVPEHVLPEDIVVDMDAKWNDVPRVYVQRLENKTGEEMLAMFPDAKDKVYDLIGVARTNSKGDRVAYKTQLGKKKNLLEVWFRYFDKDMKQYRGGLAVVDENFQYVLSKDKNPNWNYKEESSKATSNILDYPAPPFIPLNYLNDGTSYVDLTSMVEQAAPLQRILDRRGFQIMENAEMAGSGLIFNTVMIKKEDIAKLTGAPDERIGVNGDVRSAVTRVAPPPLPNYVIEDKNDARNEIDNIFATHDISRGERSANKTLGQDQIQQSQDYTRMDDIARAVERAATLYYRYLVQMMKVYYTEDHWFKAVGEDGQFDQVVMKSDMIEDGIDIAVEAGSTMPVNKQSQLKAADSLASMKMIDPLSLYEVVTGGNLPSPKKLLERYMLWSTDPQKFMGAQKDDEFDRYAFMDIQILNSGKEPEERNDIGDEYLKYFNQYMVSPDFDEQKPDVKQATIEWLRKCQAQAQKQLQALMSQAPTQEDMMAKQQQDLQQAALEQQMMGGGGAPTDPSALAGQMVEQAPQLPQGGMVN